MSESRFVLPRWDDLADLADDALPLLGTALLIASDEYPQLDAQRHARTLRAHVDHLQVEVGAIGEWPLKVAAINHHLFNELGYSGNHDAYYDPRNSYLNEVLTRRVGNPISLALVLMEVSRRLGLPLEGISFPGHFLVRLPVEEGVLIMDPFNGGRPLGVEELRERARTNLGGQVPDDQTLAQILGPAPHRAILVRMLRNLHGIYVARGEWDRAARSADRILKLAPDQADAVRDRGLAYLQLEHLAGARSDLQRYLRMDPQADDAMAVHAQLVDIGGERAQLH